MKHRISVEKTLYEPLEKFIKVEGIELEVTAADDAPLRVLLCDDLKECDLDTLYSSGWIACATALSLAKKLNIPTRQIGAIMNHLKIKIKHCSLGCFE